APRRAGGRRPRQLGEPKIDARLPSWIFVFLVLLRVWRRRRPSCRRIVVSSCPRAAEPFQPAVVGNTRRPGGGGNLPRVALANQSGARQAAGVGFEGFVDEQAQRGGDRFVMA